MDATMVAGATDTTDLLSNRIPIDMSPDISRKNENNSPFTTILDMQNKFQTCTTKKFEWMERDDYANTVTLTGAFTAAGSTLTIANDYTRLRLGDMLYHPGTSQAFRVTTSGTMDASVDVTPNFPTGSGGSNIANGEALYIMSNAQAEWSEVRQLMSSSPAAKYNYIQTIRNPFGVSGRLKDTALIGPSEMEYLDQDEYRAFSRERELALMFGVRGLQSSTTITSSGGIYYWLTQSGSGAVNHDMTGKVLSLSQFNGFLADAMLLGSSEKMLVTGRNVMTAINGFAYDKLQVNMDLSEWGLNIMNYSSPWGMVRVVYHKLFTDIGMDDEAWVIDMGELTRRGLDSERSTPHLNTGPTGTGIQDPGVDGVIYEYAVEEGLQLTHADRHARIYNVAAA